MHTMSKSKTYSLTYAVAVMSVESWKGKKREIKRGVFISQAERQGLPRPGRWLCSGISARSESFRAFHE